MGFGDRMTCQPAYVSDWRMLEREIVTALKAQAQGHHIRVGENCVAGFVNIAHLAQALRRVVVRVTFNDALSEDF